MEIVVASKHIAVEVSCAHDVTGREHLVIVAKSTWQIPAAGQRPRPLPPQAIQHADVFVGESGASAMLYGSDLVRFKPRCDVLFHASAHSPDGAPQREMMVAWRVGELEKGLRVHGPRHWRRRLGMMALSEPEEFVSMPLHFGHAFGGTRTYEKGRGERAETLTEAQLHNPVGLGWYGPETLDQADGAPAPNLEPLDDPVRKPGGRHQPAAFSAIARHWQPRPSYAGTYDQAWQENVFPFLPEDFDDKFNQCAPADQQMAYPKGGENVILRNMMAGRSDVRFTLPRLDTTRVRVLRRDYTTAEPSAPPDTLYFELDQQRFSVVWRASVPLRRDVQELATIAVGPVSAQWWQQKTLGIEGCAGCGEDAA